MWVLNPHLEQQEQLRYVFTRDEYDALSQNAFAKDETEPEDGKEAEEDAWMRKGI